MINPTTQVKTVDQDRYKNSNFVGSAMILGTLAGYSASESTKISKDSFKKEEKKLLEMVSPKFGKKEKWAELVENTVRHKRNREWELIGALAGAAVAGIVLGLSNSKSNHKKGD